MSMQTFALITVVSSIVLEAIARWCFFALARKQGRCTDRRDPRWSVLRLWLCSQFMALTYVALAAGLLIPGLRGADSAGMSTLVGSALLYSGVEVPRLGAAMVRIALGSATEPSVSKAASI